MAVTAPIFVFLLLAAPRFYAQQGATLQGHVLDTSGGTVAGATITLRSRSVDFDASVHTDSDGRYVIINGSIPSVFAAVDRVGNLGRTVVIGPAFHNTDVSIIKNIRRDKRVGLQFRADVFDLFNHANFGPPGNIVGSPTFGKITRTRFSTGEAGSSRQIQLALKAWF